MGYQDSTHGDRTKALGVWPRFSRNKHGKAQSGGFNAEPKQQGWGWWQPWWKLKISWIWHTRRRNCILFSLEHTTTTTPLHLWLSSSKFRPVIIIHLATSFLDGKDFEAIQSLLQCNAYPLFRAIYLGISAISWINCSNLTLPKPQGR